MELKWISIQEQKPPTDKNLAISNSSRKLFIYRTDYANHKNQEVMKYNNNLLDDVKFWCDIGIICLDEIFNCHNGWVDLRYDNKTKPSNGTPFVTIGKQGGEIVTFIGIYQQSIGFEGLIDRFWQELPPLPI